MYRKKNSRFQAVNAAAASGAIGHFFSKRGGIYLNINVSSKEKTK